MFIGMVRRYGKIQNHVRILHVHIVQKKTTHAYFSNFIYKLNFRNSQRSNTGVFYSKFQKHFKLFVLYSLFVKVCD